mgnify:FL=1|tara:strand:+ start:4319 stop:5626 length:1308 start_codon:yes stop_codon:yes gene_type:complete
MFGTDGIRGFPYKEPLTKKTLYKIGYSFAEYFKRKENISNIFIAEDTRSSSKYIKNNIIKGINSAGVVVIRLNILPTASLSFFTRKYPESAAIMITASHNDYRYNGIKFINTNGEKISKIDENEILKIFNKKSRLKVKKIKNITYENSINEYADELIRCFDKPFKVRKRFVIDLSNGASFRSTPLILRKLGINAKFISKTPNGSNINRNCGVEDLSKIKKYVVKNKMDFGIAIDGDADRIVFVDTKGEEIQGDKIIFFLAKSLLKRKKKLITTLMTNKAIDSHLNRKGIDVIRTDVGDKNLSKRMNDTESFLGCENSGHYIFKQHLNTSDANLTLLLLLELLIKRKTDFDKISDLKLNPSVLKSFEVSKKVPLDSLKEIKYFANSFNKNNKKDGYLNIRYSGTENKIRILIQHKKLEIIERNIDVFATILKELRL